MSQNCRKQLPFHQIITRWSSLVIVWSTLLFIMIIPKGHLIHGIRLKRFGVPGAIESGSSLWLHCDYDLEGDSLYSVKWYKNNIEFYRYMILSAQILPEHKVFPQIGIYINLEKSNTTHVYLVRTDLNTEGTFGCEVSTEAPNFGTVKAEKDLRIFVSPLEDLRIEGSRNEYNIGDLVSLTCIAGPSKPPTVVSFFMNGARVTPSNPTLNLTYSLSERELDGLVVSGLHIQFHISPTDHLVNGELVLRCEAMFASIYGVTYEELVIEEKGIYTSLKESDLDYEIDENTERPGSSFGDDDLGPPNIEGHFSRYDISDRVSINCTTPATYPPAYLEFFINDREASDAELTQYLPEVDEDSAIEFTLSVYDHFAMFDEEKPLNAILGLSLEITKEHYQTSDGALRIRCTATHAKVLYRRRLEMVLFSSGRQSSQLFASDYAKSPLFRGFSIWKLFLLMMMAMMGFMLTH